MKKEPRFGYMCKVDFDWELGEALGGSTIYPNLKDFKEHVKCHDHCGIVKVRITEEKVVKKERRYTKKDFEQAKREYNEKNKAKR